MQEILTPNAKRLDSSATNNNTESHSPCLLSLMSAPGSDANSRLKQNNNSNEALPHFAPQVISPLPPHFKQPAGPEKPTTNPPAPEKPTNPAAAPMSIISHTAHRDGKWVALTFDDGPSQYTPQVLNILKENGIHATFCLVGQQVKQYPGMVREIVAEGHKLADHSMSHDEFLPKRSDEKIKAEILGDKQLIQSVAPGAPVDYYRAPGGNWSTHVRQLCASWGMKPLGWSVDTRDWTRPGVQSILNTVQKELRPGGVILMHDAGGNRSQSVEALKQLIPILKKQGYQFDYPQ